jgi:hypothetical protein
MIDDTVRNKIPGILEDAEKLVDKADSVKEEAQDELDGLGAMDKAKAGMNCGKNVKALKTVPDMLKAFAERMKKEMEDFKTMAEEFKDPNAL